MAEIDERLFDVDEQGMLRIPGVLWLSFFLLGRYWVGGFFIYVASFLVKESLNILDGWQPWLFLLIEVPALLLFFGGVQRGRSSGKLAGLIWMRARLVMIFVGVGNILVSGYVLWSTDYWLPWPDLFIASMGLLDLVVVLWVSRSAHLSRVFAEFFTPKLES